MPEDPDPDALKPEEYLELYCQNQVRHFSFSVSSCITYSNCLISLYRQL